MHVISMTTIADRPMTMPQYAHDISHLLAPDHASPLKIADTDRCLEPNSMWHGAGNEPPQYEYGTA